MKFYQLTKQIEPIATADEKAKGFPLLVLMNSEELSDASILSRHARMAMSTFIHSNSSALDVFEDFLVGSFAILNRRDLLSPAVELVFYIDPCMLVILDDSEYAPKSIDKVSRFKAPGEVTTARALYTFMKHLIKDDLAYLSKIEAGLADLEDKLLNEKKHVSNHDMLLIRRKTFRLNGFYDQFSDMAELLYQDQSELISDEDQGLFKQLAQQSDRLQKRTESLKEYTLQLRELYQMQNDSEQNNTIQFLTVVTTVFTPLTLITGWYGMNFAYMPELEKPYGYAIIIAICIVLVIAELVYFKKKKWL